MERSPSPRNYFYCRIGISRTVTYQVLFQGGNLMKKFKTHFLFFLSLTLLLSCFSFNDTYAEESQVINFGQVVKNQISTAGELQTYLLEQAQPVSSANRELMPSVLC